MDTALTYVILRPHRQPGSRGRTGFLQQGQLACLGRTRATAEKTRYVNECDLRARVRPSADRGLPQPSPAAAVDVAGGKCVRVHIPRANLAFLIRIHNGHAVLLFVVAVIVLSFF